MRPPQPSLTQAFASVAVCVVSAGVCGAEWSAQPDLQWRMDYDSNRRLAPNGELGTEAADLSLGATLKRATELGDLMVLPHLELQRFHGEPALDADNSSLQGSWRHQAERWSGSLTADYEHASTLATELSSTGVVDASTRRNLATDTVALGRDLSETQHLDLQGSYTDVRYPDGQRLHLVGYRYPALSVSDTFKLSSLISLSFVAYGDRVTAPVVGYRSDDLGARLSVTRNLSERNVLTASVGLSQTKVLSRTSTGSVYSLRATRSSELTQWNVSYERNIQPSGFGFLSRRDTLSLGLSRSIAPTLNATAALQDVRNAGLGGPIADVPHYGSGEAGIEWHESLSWVMNLMGGYSADRLPYSNLRAHGWRTSLSLHWIPRPWSVSR